MDGADEPVVGCLRSSASRAVKQAWNLSDSVEQVVLWQFYVSPTSAICTRPSTVDEKCEARPQVSLLAQ